MAKRKSTDKAIENLMKWAEGPDWRERFRGIFQDHLGEVCERFSMTPDEVTDELMESGHWGMLFGVIFEDFVSRSFPGGNGNVVDDYLKRRGWRESARGKRYLQLLRDSVLSLYEVVDVKPGRYADIRDLVRGGAAFRVYEQMGTRNMVRWDRLAARVISMENRRIFTGGMLSFSTEMGASLLKILEQARERLKETIKNDASKTGAEQLGEKEIGEINLGESCAAFSLIWLGDYYARKRGAPRQVANRDGEELLFGEVRLPVKAGDGEAIAAMLDNADGWQRDADQQPSWMWFGEGKPATGNKQETAGEAPDDVDQTIRGFAELSERALLFKSNSRERTEQGRELLHGLLGDLVGEPLTSYTTPEQVMQEGKERGPGDEDKSRRPAGMSAEEELAALNEFKNRHYGQTMDHPIPALGDKTPRQCAVSKADREKLVDWLKGLENHEIRMARDQGQPPYDTNWIWRELGIEELR